MNDRAGSVWVAHSLFQERGSGSTPTSALSLEFFRCDTRLAIELNAVWHSVLPRISRGNIVRNRKHACYAAEFDGRYYATAIWTDAVASNRFKNGESILELRRLAIAGDSPKNTASRMIGWMVRDIRMRFPDIKRLVSYQDTSTHDGTIYAACGWHRAAAVKCRSWSTEARCRNQMQSVSDKIRWELIL